MLARQLRKQGIFAEVVLWKQVKGKALGVEFHRQVPLLDYIVDFYCHELKLVIEVDGHSHGLEGAEPEDEIRQTEIEKWGVTFIRFNDNEVLKDMDRVLKELKQRIETLQNIPLNPPSKGEIHLI